VLAAGSMTVAFLILLPLVTYRMPGFALFHSALVLHEPVRAGALAGLMLILLGVALGSDVLRRRTCVPPVASEA
jgi:hypothetical protein